MNLASSVQTQAYRRPNFSIGEEEKKVLLHKTGFKTTPRLFQSWSRFVLQVMCSSEEDRGGCGSEGELGPGSREEEGQPPVEAHSGRRTDLLGG